MQNVVRDLKKTSTIVANSKLKQFVYEDKFKMSFDNILIFTGHFINSSSTTKIGRTLYIPLKEKHTALTFKIMGQSFSNVDESVALRIRFNSREEREVVDNYDFLNDTFFVED